MEIPFNTVGLSDEMIETFSETYDMLKSRYAGSVDPDFNFSLDGFALFKDCDGVSLQDKVRIYYFGRTSYIAFAKVTYSYKTRYGYAYNTDLQAWAVATLKNDFGHVIIKPETLGDKIQEFIHPIELDFLGDEEFSKRFYVIAKNKEETQKAMSSDFRNAVMNIPGDDFFIEIKNAHLMIGNKKIIDTDSVARFAEFTSKVAAG